MPTFDDLTRAGAAGADRVKVPAVAAQVAADHWDPAFGGALRAATDAVDGANQLIDWARFVASSSQPLSEQERSDRTLFALGELGGRALPAVSSYSFTAAIGTLQNVQNDLSRRLDLSWRAWDGDSADPWGDIDRASEFSTLGVLISTSMCPWCERAINTEAVIREAWSEMSRRLGIR